MTFKFGGCMKRFAILTSGGDAPGMNAAIRAVVRTCVNHDVEIMGIEKGFAGLIAGDFNSMNKKSVSEIISKGGTMLRTARLDSFHEKEVQERAAKVLDVYNIDGLIVIGGDGSFKGAQALADLGINVIGIPGTIDNDLAYTDHTLGFDTAVNTVVDAMSKIKDTSASHDRCSIIEVMGRNCGDIALYSGIAGGAEMILVPEKPYDFEEIVQMILIGRAHDKHHFIIVMAEGAGDAQDLGKKVEEYTELETRVSVLGYLQRGGSPSAEDRILAARFGNRAVQLLCEGATNRVVGIRDNHIIDMDIHEALAMENVFEEDLLRIANEIA